MSDIWNYFTRLLGRFENSNPSEPLLHEMITRSTAEKDDYEFWKKTMVRKRLLSWLADQYAIFATSREQTDQAIDFLDTPSSKGFAIHFHQTQYSSRDARHLLDYLKEQVLECNYRTQISDKKAYNRAGWVESVERHYLKPRINFGSTEKYEQQYGNITIEGIFRDEQPHLLRFRATVYQDQQFREHFPFRELLNRLLI